MTNDYIYIRSNPFYEECIKLGKTTNIFNRDNVYATNEIKRGSFEPIYEIFDNKLDYTENILKQEFSDFNIKYDAGTEFFKKEIIQMIEPCFKKYNIRYKKKNFQSLIKVKNIVKRIHNKIILWSRKPTFQNKIIPRDYQKSIIDKTISYFSQYNKGILILPCGIGKTLLALWVAIGLGCKKICIGVPSVILLEQWKKEVLKIFPNKKCTLFGGSNNSFFSRMEDIVITTYSSASKLLEIDPLYIFDIIIFDEVHHLTRKNDIDNTDKKTFIKILDVKSHKQLSLTATPKILENYEKDGSSVISNDNIDIFGSIIDQKSISWAINNNIICDYIIQTLISEEEQLEMYFRKFNILEEKEKKLFLSAFSSLKSIQEGHSHHLLIYCNSTDNSEKIFGFIKRLLEIGHFNSLDIFYSIYSSLISQKNRENILDNFKESKYGILINVYCLSEGWDLPKLDSVVIAETMSSTIRIIQALLRAARKDKDDITKIFKILLPILNNDDWLEDKNQDHKKIREIIYYIGLEDEIMEHKIKVYKLNSSEREKSINAKDNIISNSSNRMFEYDDNLSINLRLKIRKRTTLSITYEKAKKIIDMYNNIPKNKQSYHILCDKNNRLPRDPEIFFGEQFKSWVDYLGIQMIYYDIETCKKKIIEYLDQYPDIRKLYPEYSKISEKLSELDPKFPPIGLWTEYYNTKTLEYIIEIPKQKKRKIII